MHDEQAVRIGENLGLIHEELKRIATLLESMAKLASARQVELAEPVRS